MASLNNEAKTEVRLRSVKGRESFKLKQPPKSTRPNSWHVNRSETPSEISVKETLDNGKENKKIEEIKIEENGNDIYNSTKKSVVNTLIHYPSSDSINAFSNYRVTTSKSTSSLSEKCSAEDKASSFSSSQTLCGSKSTSALDKESLKKFPAFLSKSVSGVIISHKSLKDQYSSLDNIAMSRHYKWDHTHSSSMPLYTDNYPDYIYPYNVDHPTDTRKHHKDHYYSKEPVNKYEKYEQYNPMFSQNSPKEPYSDDVWITSHQVPHEKETYVWNSHGHLYKIPQSDGISTQKIISPPAPPIRDASSLKYIKYGPGHEKHPSWPVTGSQSNNPGSHRTHSWTDQTDYPKERDPFIRPKKVSEAFTPLHPVQEKGVALSSSNENDSGQTKAGPLYYAHAATIGYNSGKTLHNEREKSKFDFTSVYSPWSPYIPAYDSEGHGYGDKDYNVPSPPERDVPICNTEGHLGISQKELDDYAKKYDDVLQHYVKTGSIQSKIELFENSKVNQKKIESISTQNYLSPNFNTADVSSNPYDKKVEMKGENEKNKKSDFRTKNALQTSNHMCESNDSYTPLMDKLRQESQHQFENMDSYQQHLVSVKENSLYNSKKWKHTNGTDFVKHNSEFLTDQKQISAHQSKSKKNFKIQTVPQNENSDKKPVESIVHSSKVQLPQRYFSESVLHYKDSFAKNHNQQSNSEDNKNYDVFYPHSPSFSSDSRRSSDSFVKAQMWLDQEEKKNHINSLPYFPSENEPQDLRKSSSFSNSSVELDSRPLSPVSDQVHHAQLWYDKHFSPRFNKRNYIAVERKDSIDEKSKNTYKHSFFDPSKKHKISDPELKAIQKEAVRSFIEMKTSSQSSHSSSSSGSFRTNDSKPCWDVARIQHLPATKSNLSPSRDTSFQDGFSQNDNHDAFHVKPKSQSLPRDYYTEFKQYQKKFDQEHKQKLRLSLEGKCERNVKPKLEAVPEQFPGEDQNYSNKKFSALPKGYVRPACPDKLDIHSDISKWPSMPLSSPVSPTGPPPPYDDNHARDWYKKHSNHQHLNHENSQQFSPSNSLSPQSPSHFKYHSSTNSKNLTNEGIPVSLTYKSEISLEAPVFSKAANVHLRAKPYTAQIHHAKFVEPQMSPPEEFSSQSKKDDTKESSTGEIISKSCKNLYQENNHIKTSIIKEEVDEKCIINKVEKKPSKPLKSLCIIPTPDQTSWNNSLDTFQKPGTRDSCSEDSLAGELPPPHPTNSSFCQTVDTYQDDCSSPEFLLPPPPIADSEIIEDIPLPPPPLPEEMAFKLQPSTFTMTYYKDSYMQYRNEHHPGRKGFGGEYTRSTPTSPSELTTPPQFVVSASSSSLSATAWEKEHNIGHRSSTVVFNSVDLYPHNYTDINGTNIRNSADFNSNEIDDKYNGIKASILSNENEILTNQNTCETETNSNITSDKLPKEIKCEDDLECDKLSADLCRQLNDKTLTSLLIPTNHKTTADYMEGLFEINVERDSQLNRRIPIGSPKKSSVAVPIGSAPQKRLSDTILPPTSAYFTTSESKAKLLTRFNRDIRQEALNSDVSSAELDKKKEDLIQRIDQKLKVLGTIQESIKDEIRENEELGQTVTLLVEKVAKSNEIDKYKRHIEELDKITNLLLSLSGRLARAENALFTLAEDTSEEEKSCLIAKRDKLLEQHEDAKKLKESIDQRSHQVAQFLKDYLHNDEFEDYNHFVKMKSRLIMDAREIDDKIKLGLEQLNALKNSLSCFS